MSRFVAETARRTGRSRRTIWEDLQLARSFTEDEGRELRQSMVPRKVALRIASRALDAAHRRELLDRALAVARAHQAVTPACAARADPSRETCDVCGAPLARLRSDARYCTAACRQRAYQRGRS